MEHGALLPFGPETLSFRVRTGRGQDAHALIRQQQQHQNDDEERPDDLQQAAAPGKEGERPLQRVLPPASAVDSYWINKPAPLLALERASRPKPRPAQGSPARSITRSAGRADTEKLGMSVKPYNARQVIPRWNAGMTGRS